MFANIEEARTANHVAVGIIDEYVQMLNRKDEVILRLSKELDEANEHIESLRKSVFPEKVEVSE